MSTIPSHIHDARRRAAKEKQRARRERNPRTPGFYEGLLQERRAASEQQRAARYQDRLVAFRIEQAKNADAHLPATLYGVALLMARRIIAAFPDVHVPDGKKRTAMAIDEALDSLTEAQAERGSAVRNGIAAARAALTDAFDRLQTQKSSAA